MGWMQDGADLSDRHPGVKRQEPANKLSVEGQEAILDLSNRA